MEKPERQFGSFKKAIFIAGNCLNVIGVLINLFVCLVMLRLKRNKRKTTLSNFFILQLSLTDFLFRGISLFAVMAYWLSEQQLSSSQCKAIIFFQYTCAAAIFVFLSRIAVDRFNHIVRPMKSLGKKQRRYVLVALTWLYAVATSVGFLVSATNRKLQLSQRRGTGTTQNGSNSPPNKLTLNECSLGPSRSLETEISVTVFFICSFSVPLVVMATAYTKTIVFLWKQAKNTLTNSVVARSKLKVTCVLIMVLMSFLASWGPLIVLDVLLSFGVGRQFLLGNYPARPMFLCICYTSSIMNPLIYGFGNSNFRKATYALFCRGRLLRVIPHTVSMEARRGRKRTPVGNFAFL